MFMIRRSLRTPTLSVDRRPNRDRSSAVGSVSLGSRGSRGVRQRSIRMWRLALPLALILVSCVGERRAPQRAPDIIILVVDTLRADRLAVYGNTRGLTPFLDELAARGTVFSNAYAPTSWTSPSIASLFTSRYPSQHGVTRFESKLGADERTLAEALAPLRYAVRGFSANFRINDGAGFGQGFAHLRSYMPPPESPKIRAPQLHRDSLEWLDSLARSHDTRPVFLYLQYMEPHAPYVPPDAFRDRFVPGASDGTAANEKLLGLRYKELSDNDVALLESLYDAEVAALDAELRAFFAALEQRGRLERAVVIVTADHGEEFREHGLMTHGWTLFEESVRVPLIVLGPGLAGGRVDAQPVTLLDVAPTLVELAGLAPEPRFEGRSLVPSVETANFWNPFTWRARIQRRDVHLELASEPKLDVRRHTEGIVQWPAKLLIAHVPAMLSLLVSDPGNPDYRRSGPLMYDLTADPGEHHPRPAADGETDTNLVAALERSRVAHQAGAHPTAPLQALDESTREKLRALGYAPP